MILTKKKPKNKQKKITGVQEWAEKSVNIQNGCVNNCTYCFGKKLAIRYNRMPINGWDHPIIKSDYNNWKKLPRNSKVMFPSVHDICNENLGNCLMTISALLERNNTVLIVSKPRIECIEAIINMNYPKDRFEFRFTIGTAHQEIAQQWEPQAPTVNERLFCVGMCMGKGIVISISCEPLLDSNCDIIDLLFQYRNIKEIWIGAMNYTVDAPKLDYLAIYNRFKDNPQIKWKESFRKHLEVK